jgi:hypothetical protein
MNIAILAEHSKAKESTQNGYSCGVAAMAIAMLNDRIRASSVSRIDMDEI